MGERLRIRVDGEDLEVDPGTSVAVALFNQGRLALRSSVTGSPRGLLCAMGVCFECRVTIDGIENRRACLEPCTPGMQVVTRG